MSFEKPTQFMNTNTKQHLWLRSQQPLSFLALTVIDSQAAITKCAFWLLMPCHPVKAPAHSAVVLQPAKGARCGLKHAAHHSSCSSVRSMHQSL